MISFALVIFLIIAFILYGSNAVKGNFRRVLSREIVQWVKEGIIEVSQAEQIKDKYELRRLETESQSILMRTIFGFGTVLVALGIIAFIAANWEVIPKYGRLVLVILAMLIAHLTGFWLWRFKKASTLGHALIVLGSLVMGANIALIAQIFHIQGNFYEGFLIWSLGLLVMGYAIDSFPHMVLAVVASFIWFLGWFFDNPQGFPIYQILCLPVFLFFAYRKQSRSLHFLSLLAWGVSVLMYLSPLGGVIHGEAGPSVFFLIVGTVSLTILFWSYGDWPYILKNQEFTHDVKILGVLAMGITAYLLSFHDLIGNIINQSFSWGRPSQLVGLGLLLVMSVTSKIYGFFKGTCTDQQRTPYWILTLSGLIIIPIPLLAGSGAMIVGTVLGNLAAIILGSFLLWRGLTELDRRYFWLGLFGLVLVVIGRFFEYETGLLLKSLSFIIAGLSLIVGGICFEKKREKVIRDEVQK